MKSRAWVIGALALVAVAGHARGEAETSRRIEASVGQRFEALRRSYGDLTYADLERRLDLRERPARLTFDPTRVKYYAEVRRALDLTREEQNIYRKTGMVAVDHGQRYTMASSYLAIYRNDLPVLITVDSILHALHRSFDAILVEIEAAQLAPALEKILAAAHERLKSEAAKPPGARPGDVAKDVDLYLSVARNLLVDAQKPKQATEARALGVPSLFGQDAAVRAILGNVAALASARLSIYGGSRDVDWSQFKPRGHYANTPALRRYFETMMWLGRADLGFHLSPPAGGSGLDVDLARERADAVVLTDLLRGAGQLNAMGAIDLLLSYLVGPSDNTEPAQIALALQGEGGGGLARLSDRAVAARVIAAVPAKRQEILSQALTTTAAGPASATLPELFQLFGQRFVIDSFVLSKVVGDTIGSRGARAERPLPSGLDVMAALGDDEAVRVLRPELEKFGYAANLLAARTLLNERPAAARDATAYDVWLDALAQLGRGPGGAVPEVMRQAPWRRKELQTQLASWAELRHDTILYVKQSYSSMICEYPAGYVEPYPKVFARIAFLADELGRRLAKLGAASERMRSFLPAFAARVRQLQGLAEKELAGKPFTAEEAQLIKDAIHLKHEPGGCTGPQKVYTGWYPTLLYGGSPDSWEPTVADVHTAQGTVLEVGTGDVDFMVVAVDNGGDRAAYVGPVYSYYEFTSDNRLTDDEWRARLASGNAPARPAWAGAFQALAKARTMVPPPADPKEAKGPVADAGAEGSLNLAAFYVGIKTAWPQLGACVDRFKLQKHLEVEVEITPSGRVRDVAITQGGAMPPEAQRCIKEAVSRAQFDRSERGLRIPYSIIGP